MKKETLAYILAPSPFIILLILLCLYVLLSPIGTIYGVVDNDPFRAAEILLILIPFLFYPGSLLIFAIQIFIARKLKGNFKRNILYSTLLVGLSVSALQADALHAPQFGESFLLIWAICSVVFIILLLSMVGTWRLIRGHYN